MHTHPRHPSGAGQTAGVWDFVIIHYTKYELAYPCGNDANTGVVHAIRSSRSRKTCMASCACAAVVQAQEDPGIQIRTRKIIFCVEGGAEPFVFIPFAKGGIAHLVLPEWLHECCQPVGDSSECRSQTHTCSQVYPRTVKKIQNWWKRDREIWYLAVFNLRFVSASMS